MQEPKSKGQGLQWSINLLFQPTSFLICFPISERVPCLKYLFVWLFGCFIGSVDLVCF